MIQKWVALPSLVRRTGHKVELDDLRLFREPFVCAPAQPTLRVIKNGERKHGSGLLWSGGGGKSIRSHRRVIWLCVGASSHAAEDVQIKEVHPAEYEEHHADLYRQRFNALFSVVYGVAELEGQADVTEVDQVKANDEQVIDRIGEAFVAMEDIDEEHA